MRYDKDGNAIDENGVLVVLTTEEVDNGNGEDTGTELNEEPIVAPSKTHV